MFFWWSFLIYAMTADTFVSGKWRDLTASSEMLIWRPINETIKGISSVYESFILVPADWEDENSPMIPINLRKFVKGDQGSESKSNANVNNIWYVPGGPGQSSQTLEVMLPVLLPGVPYGTTFYAFDHRGLGKSTPLANEQEKALLEEYPKDRNLLPQILKKKQEKLGIMTPLTRTLRVENVARDLLKAVELVNRSNRKEKNYLIGISYGTLVSRRALQISRDGTFEAVMLDGLASVENLELMNESDRMLQEICDLLPACKGQLDHLIMRDDEPSMRKLIPGIIEAANKGMNLCTAYFMKSFAESSQTLCHALHELMNATILQGLTSLKVASLRLMMEMITCKNPEEFMQLFDTVNDMITMPRKSVNSLQSASVVASTAVESSGGGGVKTDVSKALSSDELVFEVVSALERHNVTDVALDLCYNRKREMSEGDGKNCPARLFDPCKFFRLSYDRRVALKQIYGELPANSLSNPLIQLEKTRIMVLAGNFDFNTPTWISRHLAHKYTFAPWLKYHEFFGYGHSMFGSSDCNDEILADFLDGNDRTSQCAMKWNLKNMWKVNDFFNVTLPELNSILRKRT